MKRIIAILTAAVMLLCSMQFNVVFAQESVSLTLNTDGFRENFKDYMCVVTGSSVLFNEPEVADGYSLKYFRGEEDITESVTEGYISGTVALPVVFGNNVFKAKLYKNGALVAQSPEIAGIQGINLINTATKPYTGNLQNYTSALKSLAGSNNDDNKTMARAILEYDPATGTYGRSTVYRSSSQSSYSQTYYSDYEVVEINCDINLSSTPSSDPVYFFGYREYEHPSDNTYTEIKASENYQAFGIGAGTTNLYIHGVDTGISLTLKKWYNFKCRFDSISGYIDLYMDDVCVAKNIAPGFELGAEGRALALTNPCASNTRNYNTIFYSNPAVNVLERAGEFVEMEDPVYVADDPTKKLPVESDSAIDEDTVVIECEDMNIVNTDIVSVKNSTVASGGKFLYSHTSSSNISTVYSPDVQYTAYVRKPGVYNVWVRAGSYGTETNPSGATAFYVSLNGGQTYSRVTIPYENSYDWARIGRASINDGILDISFAYRNSNIAYDKLVITADNAFRPTGRDDVPNGDTTSWYPKPGMNPPSGHPRVYITKDDYDRIRSTVTLREMASHFSMLKSRAGTTYMTKEACMRTTSHTHTSCAILAAGFRARSLLYIVNNCNATYGRETIELAKLFLRFATWGSMTNRSRAVGNAMQAMAIVYDWHYDLLTDSEKEYFIAKLKQWAITKETGYPPTGSSVYGHPCEGEVYRDLLSVGAAIYDEDPEVWNLAAGKFWNEMIPAKKFFAQSGNHGSGTKYGGSIRAECELLALWLFREWGVTSEQLFGKGFDEVPLRFIYSRTPYGQFMNEGEGAPLLAIGWQSTGAMSALGKYLFDDSQYADLYLGEWAKYTTITAASNYASCFDEILTCALFSDDANTLRRTPDHGHNMPLTHFTTYPLTQMYARTNWQTGIDSPAALAYVQGREVIAETKLKPDIGSFQLFYKGYLTAQSSYPGGSGFLTTSIDRNYNRRTVAHNAMTVYDPYETFFANYYYYDGKSWTVLSNDGGQNTDHWFIESRAADLDKIEDVIALGDISVTEGMYAGPNKKTPEFSYLKTDLTNAYGGRRVNKTTGKTLVEDLKSKGYSVTPEKKIPTSVMNPSYKNDYVIQPKLSDYKRSSVFIDLNNEDYPAAFIVFDKIDSTNATFEKNWLLHSSSQPAVNGNVTTIANTFGENNGKLVVNTLLPANPDIEVIGGTGKEAWVDGANYTSLSQGDAEEDDDASLDDDDVIEESTATETNYGWRIEVSPSTEAKEDLFLHAMYMTDADSTAEALPMTKVETDKFVGVTVLDKLVMFSKTATSEEAQFDITVPNNNSGSNMSVLITDVAEGKWSVKHSNGTVEYYEVKDEENSLYFSGKPGKYTISPVTVSSVTVPAREYAEMDKNKPGDFVIYSTTEYVFKTQNHPTKLIGGKPFVSAVDFYTSFGVSCTENNDGSVTINANNSSGAPRTVVIEPNSQSYTVDSTAKTLTTATKVIDGILYVNPLELEDYIANIALTFYSEKLSMRASIKTFN